MASNSTSGVPVAYDGSRPAQNAIAHAARVFPGTPRKSRRCGVPSVRPARLAPRCRTTSSFRRSTRTAEDGAERAGSAGMSAPPLVISAEPSVWASIIAAADTYDARAVVVGSRGRSGLRSALLGSVSNAVVHRCRRPVVVVHPADREELMAPDNANAAARHSGSR